MANLVKIAELLKNAPDQALMQQLNNPGGGAPSYMVLSELQRRKKLRGSLMNNEPQSSVAEDLEAESAQAPQMGLGSMGQQPQQMQPQQAPQGYAGGGEVQGYAAGGLPQGYDPTVWEMFEDPSSGEVYPRKKLTGLGAWGANLRAQAQGQPSPVPTGSGIAAAQAPVTVAPTIDKTPPATPAKDTSGLGAFRPAAPAKANAQPAAPAEDPILSEMKAIGAEQKTAYQKLADTYQQQADEVKRQKSSDIGMALMQAGLGIAGGTSSNALQNVAQGAQPAMQAYIGMDRARREQLQKLAMGQGAVGIEELGARQKGLGLQGEYGLGQRKLELMGQEIADKRAYQQGMLGAAQGRIGTKMNPLVMAQANALEAEIDNINKNIGGMFGKEKQAALARINMLTQQKSRLLGLSTGDAEGTPTSAIPSYNPATRSW